MFSVVEKPPYNYLAFRRMVIFCDEWLSYVLLIYLYYYLEERNLMILLPTLGCIITFNFTGYLYLHYLEIHYNLYGFEPKQIRDQKKEEQVIKNPLFSE